MKRTLLPLLAAASLAAPTVAQAQPADNAIQPNSVHFGHVLAGTHPMRQLTLRNPTSRVQTIHRFLLEGAGGRKFALAFGGETCRVGTRLAPGGSCTFRVRVATTKAEWWQSVISVFYGGRDVTAKARGQFNSSVYAHIVEAG